tara:strand:+ start:500 stop:841 length:342 start_codon:yes stop_codon:yes gene_type:complete
MEPITTAIIASSVYDMLKHGMTVSKTAIKERLGDWIRDDVMAEKLAEEVRTSGVDDEMSEKALDRCLASSSEITELIKAINENKSNNTNVTARTVNQVHYGQGDNVFGTKTSK